MGKELRWWFVPAGAALMVLLATLLWLCNPAPEPPQQTIIILGQDGQEQEIELERFLVGVVAAEMPARFEAAALQAQAIAARTYIAARLAPYGAGKHGAAAVCCDSRCCQAYLDEHQLKAAWGSDYDHFHRRIAAAVEDSAGQILLWQDRPAEALFHSTCGGCTEDAAAVWGRAIPYLTSVSCGYCATAPRFTGQLNLSVEQAAAALGLSPSELRLLHIESYTGSGRAATLRAGEKTLSAAQMRQALGLNSTAISWLILGDNIIFTSVGYGHGAGLCQYGANGMAEAGYTAADILRHYYHGCELGVFSNE